jgi:hypothetical protein
MNPINSSPPTYSLCSSFIELLCAYCRLHLLKARCKVVESSIITGFEQQSNITLSDQLCILGVERQQQPLLYYLTVDDRLRQDITDSSGFFFSKCIGGVVRVIEVHRRGWKAGSRDQPEQKFTSRDVLYVVTTL